jgi:RimJ/RimL family protein N-acetyltransferase
MAVIEPKQVTLRDGTRLWIRSAELGDIGPAMALRAHLFVTSPHQVSGPGDEWTPEMAREKIEKAAKARGGLWLVATPSREPGSEIVGSIHFRSEDRKKVEHHGTLGIGNMAEWRGRGVGTALIEALLEWAAGTEHIEKVVLGVFATNLGARKLYRRLGFRTESRAKRFFKLGPGEYVDDIQMCIYVKPGVAPQGFLTWEGKTERRDRKGRGANVEA